MKKEPRLPGALKSYLGAFFLVAVSEVEHHQ